MGKIHYAIPDGPNFVFLFYVSCCSSVHRSISRYPSLRRLFSSQSFNFIMSILSLTHESRFPRSILNLSNSRVSLSRLHCILEKFILHFLSIPFYFSQLDHNFGLFVLHIAVIFWDRKGDISYIVFNPSKYIIPSVKPI